MPRAATKTNGHPAIKPITPPAPDRTALFVSAIGAAIDDKVVELLPSRASAAEVAAAEYWGASKVLAYAEQRREKAKKAALALGVLPNYIATPFPVGTSETIYADPTISIAMQVAAQADRIDTLPLLADLERTGMKAAVLKRLAKKHTRSFPGAHIFTASLTPPG